MRPLFTSMLMDMTAPHQQGQQQGLVVDRGRRTPKRTISVSGVVPGEMRQEEGGRVAGITPVAGAPWRGGGEVEVEVEAEAPPPQRILRVAGAVMPAMQGIEGSPPGTQVCVFVQHTAALLHDAHVQSQ